MTLKRLLFWLYCPWLLADGQVNCTRWQISNWLHFPWILSDCQVDCAFHDSEATIKLIELSGTRNLLWRWLYFQWLWCDCQFVLSMSHRRMLSNWFTYDHLRCRYSEDTWTTPLILHTTVFMSWQFWNAKFYFSFIRLTSFLLSASKWHRNLLTFVSTVWRPFFSTFTLQWRLYLFLMTHEKRLKTPIPIN